MKLLFSTGKDHTASAICAFTWSRWSHVDLLSSDGKSVIGAVIGRGVVHVTIASRLAESRRAAVMDLDDIVGPLETTVWRFAQMQVGKPYDLTAVIGLSLHRCWSEPDSWFSSELVATALDWAGCCPYDKLYTRRITPQDLWVLNRPKWTLDLAAPVLEPPVTDAYGQPV